MTTADRIRDLRKARHMTQTQLADKCHATKQAVSMWETGNAMPSRISLEALCDIFNVEMDYLTCRQSVSMRYLNTEELDVIDAYRSLSYDQQTMICDMLHVKRGQDASNPALSSTSSLGA